MQNRTRNDKRIQRHKRIRSKIVGSAARPRLQVFRSNKHLYVQLFDDEKGRVLAMCSDRELKVKKKTDLPKDLAQCIASKAKEQKIKNIVFDRAGYTYHGKVKTLADELRSQGLSF